MVEKREESVLKKVGSKQSQFSVITVVIKKTNLMSFRPCGEI